METVFKQLLLTDVVDANSVSGRQYFAFGEEIVLMCNTIPPNISVTWEVQRDGEFEPVNDALVHYEPSSSLRTVLRFTASLVTLGNSYQCRGTGLLINEVSSSVFITIIPGTECSNKNMYFYANMYVLYNVYKSCYNIYESLPSIAIIIYTHTSLAMWLYRS